MKKLVACALILTAAAPVPARALELTRVRSTTGLLGSPRPGNKFLPGDIVFLNFDIEGVQIHPKSGYAVYQTTLQITDSGGAEILNQVSAPKRVILLGGKQLPCFAYAILGADLKAGRYQLKMTVDDLAGKSKAGFVYDFEITSPQFGIVQPVTPGVAFLGQDFAINFGIVGMDRDDESLPDVKIDVDIKDAAGKSVLPLLLSLNARDLHNPPAADLTKRSVIPIMIPVFLNRPGRFTVAIQAEDKIGQRVATLNLPLQVLDDAQYTGK